MKKVLLFAVIAFMLGSCKKSSQNYPTPLQIEVSDLTEKTSVSIKAINLTQSNITLLDIRNQFGNRTYPTAPVKVGDKIQITVSANIVVSNVQGDGVGTFKFTFEGRSAGAHGGQIGSFTITETMPAP